MKIFIIIAVIVIAVCLVIVLNPKSEKTVSSTIVPTTYSDGIKFLKEVDGELTAEYLDCSPLKKVVINGTSNNTIDGDVDVIMYLFQSNFNNGNNKLNINAENQLDGKVYQIHVNNLAGEDLILEFFDSNGSTINILDVPLNGEYNESTQTKSLEPVSTYNFVLCTIDGVKKMVSCGSQTHDYEASNSAISSGFIIYEERPVSTYTNEKILGVDTNQDIVEVDRNTLFQKYSTISTSTSTQIQIDEHYFLVGAETKTLPLLSSIPEGHTIYFQLNDIISQYLPEFKVITSGNDTTNDIDRSALTGGFFSYYSIFRDASVGVNVAGDNELYLRPSQFYKKIYFRICKFGSNWYFIELGFSPN